MGSSHSRVQPGTPNLLLTNMPEQEAWLQSPLALEPTVRAHSTLYHDFLTAAGRPHCDLPQVSYREVGDLGAEKGSSLPLCGPVPLRPPSTSLPSPLLTPLWLTGLLAVPQMCQAQSCLRTLALAVPAVWCTLSFASKFP